MFTLIPLGGGGIPPPTPPNPLGGGGPPIGGPPKPVGGPPGMLDGGIIDGAGAVAGTGVPDDVEKKVTPEGLPEAGGALDGAGPPGAP